jgi:phospho-2-dehydro-3-deoxyheptonate aldolase
MSAQEQNRELLIRDWAMDGLAADVLAERLDINNQLLELSLSDWARTKRDEHRIELEKIFIGTSSRIVICIGPCSLDMDVDYTMLYDYIEELQEQNPNALICMRANGAKPRTSQGWKGLWYSTDVRKRERLFEIYHEAAERGIPLLTEATENTQLGALAPFLSGVWIGARDVESTAMRGSLSVLHLPTSIKNGQTGDPKVVENTLLAVNSNSEKMKESGSDLGTIASTATFPGFATGILPVGEGNMKTAIVARGYELPENMSVDERREKAINHLSKLCILGKKYGNGVLLDLNHKVPAMFDVPDKDPDRSVAVLDEFHRAIIQGEIIEPQQLIGVLGEVGPVPGQTDPNYLLDKPRRLRLSRLVKATTSLLVDI